MSPSQINATWPPRPWEYRLEVEALWADIDPDPGRWTHDEVKAAAAALRSALSRTDLPRGRKSFADVRLDELLGELDGIAKAPDDAWGDDYTRVDDLADCVTKMYDWADDNRVAVIASAPSSSGGAGVPPEPLKASVLQSVSVREG